MNVTEAIKSRRSIRTFTGASVSDEQLQSIMLAAQAAPVGMGAYKNVNLTVIKNKALIDEIDKATQDSLNNHDRSFLYGAPTLILVSVKLAPAPYCNVGYSNAACIVENMALEAVELGVGACHIWGAVMAIAENKELVAKFSLPEGFSPVCAIAVGETEEKYEEKEIPMDRIKVNVIE